MNKYAHLAGRILLAHIFVLSGISKIAAPAATVGYMQSVGLPAILLWPTIAVEVLGGIAVIVGFQTRLVAIVLAAFTVLAAILFHSNFGDQVQMIMFMKDISITGGLLLLAASGAGYISIDNRK